MSRYLTSWAVLCLLSILAVFRVSLNSDLLFLESVATDLFRYSGHWTDWKLTPAPAYFPDMLFYFMSFFAFDGAVSRIVLVCAGQAALLAWVGNYLAVSLRPALSWNAKSVLVLVVAATVLIAANSNMWLFFNSTNNHFAALVLPIFCVGLVLRFFASGKQVWLICLAIAGALGTASTTIFVLVFTVPAFVFGVVCCYVFRATKSSLIAAVKVLGFVLLGHFVGLLLSRLASTFDALSGRVPVSFDGFIASARHFVAALQVSFGADNLYTFVFALSCLLGCGWVFGRLMSAIRLGPSGDDSTSILVLADVGARGKSWYSTSIFVFLTFAVAVVGVVVSGGFADQYGLRYLAFPIALVLILWLVELDAGGVLQSSRASLAVFAAASILMVLGATSIGTLLERSGRSSFADVWLTGRAFRDEDAACLDAVERDGFRLASGIGDFWRARGVSYKMKRPVFVLPVTKDAKVFFHMMSIGPLVEPVRYGIRRYNFAIIGKSGSLAPFDMTPETIGKVLPKPTKVVACDHSDSEVWLYETDELDQVVRRSIGRLMFELGRGGALSFSAADLPGIVGRVVGSERVAVEGVDQAGFVAYGPYIELGKGRYRAIVNYTSTALSNRWDVGRFGDPSGPVMTFASGDLPVGVRARAEATFELPQTTSYIEVRSWFGGHGDLKIHGIAIERVK